VPSSRAVVITLESAPGLWRRTEGDGDLPEQYIHDVSSMMASLVR
jgi:hypothetical protein